MKRGQTADAISELLQALGSDLDGTLHYQLFILYRKFGQQQAAEAALAKSKALALSRHKHWDVTVNTETPDSASVSTPQKGAIHENSEKEIH